jgi:hypothetical protein
MSTWLGTTTSYSVASNWVGAILPSPTQDAVFDGLISNAPCVINNSSQSCLRFRVINGYNGTITFTNSLSVYGNYEVDAASATSWTFSALAATGLLFRASAIIDIPATRVTSCIGISILSTGVNVNITLARDTTVLNIIGIINGPNTLNIARFNRTSAGVGENLNVTGNFTSSSNVLTLQGTAAINFTGSGTSVIFTNQEIYNNININSTGTLTGNIYWGGGSILTYNSGTTTALNLNPTTACSIVSNGTSWNNITLGSGTGRTLTITTDLIYLGVLTGQNSAGWTIVHVGGSVIRCRGTGFNNGNVANATVIIEPTAPCTVSTSNQTSNINLTFNPFPGGQITYTAVFGVSIFSGASILTYLTSNGGPTPLATGFIGISGTNSSLTANTSPSSTNYIIFNGLTFGAANQSILLLSDLHINGPFGKANNNVSVNGSGYKLILGPSTVGDSGIISGTGTIQLSYTGAWNNLISINNNNLIISPFSGQTVTIQAITKAINGGTITYTPGAGTLVSSASTLSISGSTTMLTSGMSWNNITISNTVILTINSLLSLTGTLLCSGSATFAGTHGWTTLNFSCTVAGAIIRLQNIIQFTSAEYIVNGLLNLVGTLGNRLILEASGRANFTGSIAVATAPTGSTMTLSAPPSTGTIVVGMTVSQATGQIPPGLSPFINDRPTIESGASLSWVLNKTLTTRVPTPSGTIALAAGFKAKFTLANNGTSLQNVVYVQTQDIDSSFGKAIFVTGSNGDDAPTEQALFRTLNWGPLVVQSGSVYYTFVN